MGWITKILDSWTSEERKQYRDDVIRLMSSKGAGANWIAHKMKIRKSIVRKLLKQCVT